MKLLIMQFSPTSCLLIPLWSKYSPLHCFMKSHCEDKRPCPIKQCVWGNGGITSFESLLSPPSSSTCRFTPKERASAVHRIRGWVGPRAGLDDAENRRFLTLLGSNSDPSVVQPVSSRYTHFAGQNQNMQDIPKNVLFE
jgi:hypothetical protein